MLITVIIPTCNRNDLLIQCLDKLAPEIQTIKGSYEVIISDDSKNDIAKDLVFEKYQWAKWISGPKKGPAANRNNGAKNASGEWLVFIDDDCLAQDDVLQQYEDAINNSPGSLAFEGAILPDDWDKLKKDMSECPVNTDGGCFWSANVCIKASLFKQIGGFNENYLIAAQEDQQIKIDIENSIGKKITFLRNCVVVHPVRFTTLKKQLTRIPIASKNFCLYAYKNRSILHLDSIPSFAVRQYLFHLRGALHLMRSGKAKSAIVSFAWLIYGVPLNIINMLKIRTSKV